MVSINLRYRKNTKKSPNGKIGNIPTPNLCPFLIKVDSVC